MQVKTRSASRFAALASVLAFALVQGAHAAIDVGSATSGVSDAGTAATTVLGAMIGVVAIVWGLRKVIGLLRG